MSVMTAGPNGCATPGAEYTEPAKRSVLYWHERGVSLSGNDESGHHFDESQAAARGRETMYTSQ